MKKLLSVTPHLSTGGAPQVLVKRVELIKDVLDVYVVEFANISDAYVIQKNRLKKLLKPDHFWTLGDNKRELLDIIDKVQPDYIHFEEIPELFGIDYTLTRDIYKADRKYKIFETTHSSDFNVDEKIFFPDKFLFVSQYNCFKFNKFGIPAEVIEYPVEKKAPDPIKKAQAMKRIGLDPKFKHVVNVGLFTPRKNQAYAFEIAKKLENEKIKFHFIGNQADNFKSYWEPLLKDKPKNCVIWGERDDIDDFLDACDVFLFTSRGFRWNKELNPLVIKEALEHQIHQFLFPLDVYNRKYDIEDTISYLDGNADIDAAYVKNYLFPREIKTDKKYKIRAVHLLLEEDNRKKDSIKELERLKEFGIDYVQHINKRYTDTPPRELCARPDRVGRIEAYALKGPHYGNYQSFKKAILTEFTDDVDFLIVFESDCKLTVPIEEFVDKVYQSCDPIIERGIYYMSFGDNRNLRTGEMVSDDHGKINDWMYITNKIIGIQSIMFPKQAFGFIKRAYETTLWDVSDLMFNEMFKNKGKAIAPRLTTQIEGVSTIQGEQITHFLLKDEQSLINDKNPNDILVEFNKEEQKFYICLSDFYKGAISDIKVVVNADKNKNIYSLKSTVLSPFDSTWIQIYGHGKYNEFSFDFYFRDQFLFTKKVQLDGLVPDSNSVKETIQSALKDKGESVIILLPGKNEFNLDFKIDENKLYIPYSGQDKDVTLKVVVKNLDTGEILYTADELVFNNGGYCNWISTGINLYKTNPDFTGFQAEFFKNNKFLFTKELVLREKKKQIIDIEAKEIIKTGTAFAVLTYPDTKIKEDITEKCIDKLKNTNHKIILSSHYPVNKKLQEKVDYYLYDAYNPLISHTLYNFYWSTIPQGKIQLHLDKLQKNKNLNQSLVVLNNIENSIKFAKFVGIDKVVCMSYDFLFNEDNIKTINNICERIDKEGKNGYFMLYHEEDMTLYKSVFFIVKTDFYSKVFNKITRTPDEYNNECKNNGAHNFLENYFYTKLLPYSNELIIEDTNEDKLFNNKEINLFSGVEYLSVVPVNDKPNSFVVWFNSSNNKDNRRIEFTFNNNGKIDSSIHYIKDRSYYMKKIDMVDGDDYTITAKFIDSTENRVIDEQKFNVNKSNYKDIVPNGLFTESV